MLTSMERDICWCFNIYKNDKYTNWEFEARKVIILERLFWNTGSYLPFKSEGK